MNHFHLVIIFISIFISFPSSSISHNLFPRTLGNSKQDYISSKCLNQSPIQKIVSLIKSGKELFRSNPLNQKYKFLEKIGDGSFGMVYEIMRKSDDRHLAIKMGWAKGDQILKDQPKIITKEIYILEKSKHINGILELIDWALEEECDDVYLYYIITPLIKKSNHISDLYSYLFENHKDGFPIDEALPFELSLNFLKQIVEPMAKVHSLGIAHLDLKPENILINDDSKLTIIDFGLSWSREYPQVNMDHGSYLYISPERETRKQYDPFQQDVWSIGIIFYLFLFKTGPFDYTDSMGSELFKYGYDYHHSYKIEKSQLKHMISNCPVCEKVLNMTLQYDPKHRSTLEQVFAVLDK